ncbi:hypothetical protein EDD17DRAFT_1523098 [Pisolithus thermaeus]|nr:hypothetical protein EDD17DRAFT_1523098 [Pisolithus thermaeus]
MFDETIGKIIPFRIKILLGRDKPARTPRNYSVAAGLQDVSARIPSSNSFQVSTAPDQQRSVVVSSSRTSQVLSLHNISDTMQIALPMVQAAAAAIPVVGAPLASVIGELLAVIQVINTSTRNREALDGLTRRLYTLSCHIANAPTAQTPFEDRSRQVLIKALEDATNQLRKAQSRIHGSIQLTQDINGCVSKINDSIQEFMLSSQFQLLSIMQTNFDSISRFMVGKDERLPAGMTVSCAVVVDATGEEHRMPLDQCCSFDRLIAFLPGILSQCRPDKADIQRWYIDRGQYDFVIDNGTNIAQLTRESDIWSTIEPGTKIVMRVITTEVSRTFSASYQCHCGKWNEVKVDQGAVLDVLKDGFIITCYYCERRFQITVTMARKKLRAQGENSESKDDGPAEEEKSLIRNIWKKQVT